MPRSKRLPLQLVFLLILALQRSECAGITSGIGALRDDEAEVGENFTFTFPVKPKETLADLYLQYCTPDCVKPSNPRVFVNGFYGDEEVNHVVGPQFANRTSFDRSRLSVTILGIRVQDEGNYEWTHQDMPNELHIHLRVSAKYKTPTLTVISCWPAGGHQEGGSGDRDTVCMLKCTSHGGHPGLKVEWDGSVTRNATLFKPINNSQEKDPETSLFKSSSTVQVSCPEGPLHLQCSVGGSTPANAHVCETERKPPNPLNWCLYVFAGVVPLFVVVCVVAVCLVRRRRGSRDHSETGAGDKKETFPLNANGTENKV